MSGQDTWVGWTDEPEKGRSTFGIISTCLTTIFLCTWTAVHHDIPPAGRPERITILKKTAWMAGAILAPELITAWALYQYLRARALTVWMQDQDIPWTIDHSFCLIMGGFTYDFSKGFDRNTSDIRPLTVSNVETVVRHGRADFSAITKEHISDKSKADPLTKVLTCFQAIYLVIQILGRVCQHLPITSLEASTAGYVPWTLLSYFFWWKKPFNIQLPTQILDRSTPIAGCTTRVVLNGSLNLHTTDLSDLVSLRYRRDRAVLGAFFTIATVFGAIHVGLWNAPIFATAVERYLWRATSLGMMIIPTLEAFIIFVLANSEEKTLLSIPSARVNKSTRWAIKYSDRFRLFLGVWGEAILPLLFVAVRLCIIVEIFYGLHSLPKEVYAEVHWGNFIPHLSLI